MVKYGYIISKYNWVFKNYFIPLQELVQVANPGNLDGFCYSLDFIVCYIIIKFYED